MSLFLTFFNSKSIYKTNEDTNFSIERTFYKDYNLLRRYAFDRDLQRGALTTRDTLIYLLQNVEFLINIQKSILNLTPIFEFLGVLQTYQYVTMSLPTEKARAIQE